jgi:acyl-coenzyme A synthetase/AMP-(fatty) acid ligase
MRGSIDDALLGAGNVLFWLRDHGKHLTSPGLLLDGTWAAPDGTSRAELSLADILSCAAVYRRLYRELGVRSGDVVVVHLKTSIDVYVHWVALASEGAITAPVNPNLSTEMVKEYCRRIGAIGILAAPSASERDGSPATGLSWYRSIDGLSSAIEVAVCPSSGLDELAYSHRPEDIVLICHTSGTTGQPKAVSASHHGFLVGIRSELSQPGCPLLGSTMLSALPVAHMSSLATITWALLSSTKLVLASDQSAGSLVADVGRFKPESITSFSCTLRDVARLNLPAAALSSVGLWMTTGDASRRRDIAAVSALGTHPVTCASGVSRAPGMFVLDCFGSSELG